MNKKLLGIVLGVFCLALLTAAISHYVGIETTFNINNIDGIGEYPQSLGDFEFGDTISGALIPLVNDLSSDRNLSFSDDSPEEIDVSYKSTLELTKKDVNFTKDVWDVFDDKVQIEYTLVGDEFSAEVTEGAVSGYELIYYKDAETLRFDNPEKAIRLNEIVGNLPYAEDGNAEEYDYCITGEYNTCHGAKIWYVPSDAINTDGTLQWNRASEFYFESKLIQYNSGGEITFYSGDSLDVTPEYTPSKYAEGTYTINTTIA